MCKGHVAGAIGDLKAGGLFETHRIGDRDHPVGIEDAFLGQAALAGIDGHPLTGFKPLHRLTYSANFAGDFHPKCKRCGRNILIGSILDQKVGEIEAAGADAQPHLSGTRILPFY